MSIEFRKMSDFNRGILFGFTNDDLISAQRMYESVGFEIQKKRNEKNIIAVRVFDSGRDGGIYEGPVGLITQTKYIDYWRKIKKEGDE